MFVIKNRDYIQTHTIIVEIHFILDVNGILT